MRYRPLVSRSERLLLWRVGHCSKPLSARRHDVTDLGVGAVGWVESMATSDEPLELSLEGGELTLSSLDVVQLGRQKLADVSAGRGTFAAQLQDGGDLDQGEPGPLCAADELEAGEDRRVVEAVAVGTAPWLLKQTLALVEADGLGRQPCDGGDFSDVHDLNLRLDLAPWIKV